MNLTPSPTNEAPPFGPPPGVTWNGGPLPPQQDQYFCTWEQASKLRGQVLQALQEAFPGALLSVLTSNAVTDEPYAGPFPGIEESDPPSDPPKAKDITEWIFTYSGSNIPGGFTLNGSDFAGQLIYRSKYPSQYDTPGGKEINILYRWYGTGTAFAVGAYWSNTKQTPIQLP